MVGARNAKGETPLQLAMLPGHEDQALLLVEKMPAEALLLRDQKGDTCLHVTARHQLKAAALKTD